MSENPLSRQMLAAIEDQLKGVIALADGDRFEDLHFMLAYHMGWEGEGAGPQARGKRIRPLLVTLACAAAGGEWQRSLPAAAAVEILHNFSLIHDDIEDNSTTRRGRPTLWCKWGIPLAINAGDTLFTLANLALMGLEDDRSAVTAARIFQDTCLQLTKGQHLDISYEKRRDLDLEAYWPMIGGKTAALLQACTRLGALSAEASEEIQQAYADFGFNLGLAFQVKDDLLGIWGDSAQTGKSAASDLLAGKNSLPVLYGISQGGSFAQRWSEGHIREDEVADLAHQLEAEGARVYTSETASCLTRRALEALRSAAPAGESGQYLEELAKKLLKRKI